MGQRIVVVGAGFAGVWSALGAKRLLTSNLEKGGREIEVVVIAPEARLVIRPRLYEAEPAGMRVPLEDLFRVAGVEFIQGTILSILSDKHEVVCMDPVGTRSIFSYDKLILAAGSRLQRPEIPGLHKFSFDIDQLETATKLEAHLKSLSSINPSMARNTVVVCGGGFTGIELAAELPERLRKILGQDADVRVILVERGEMIGPELGPNPRPVIVQALNDLGVEMKLGAAVTAVDADGVILGTGERLETLTAVWTAGVVANELNKLVPGEKDKFGRLHVDGYLRTLSVRDIFATGDAAFAATDDEGNFNMMSCQHAMPLGTIAGNNAAADLLGIDKITYRQPDYVTCLDLGSFGAVFCEGWDRKVTHHGPEAKAMKHFINRTLIYPPKADPAEIFTGADPAVSGIQIPGDRHSVESMKE
jgi:NADH:ubiquinone reductase (H+-translocating)